MELFKLRSSAALTLSFNKPMEKKSWKKTRQERESMEQRVPICLIEWLCSATAIPWNLSHKKSQGATVMQADSLRAAKTLSSWFLEQHRGCHGSRSDPVPAQLSALALCLFLQRALDEGQFVWMVNAAALAGGGLYEMVQWFVEAGGGLV